MCLCASRDATSPKPLSIVAMRPREWISRLRPSIDPSLIKAALPPVKTRPRRDRSSGTRRGISPTFSSRKHISRRSGNWAANGGNIMRRLLSNVSLLVLLSGAPIVQQAQSSELPESARLPMRASAVPDNLPTDISGRRGGGGGHIGGRPGGGHGHFGRPGGGRPGGGVGRPGGGRPGHIGRPGGVRPPHGVRPGRPGHGRPIARPGVRHGGWTRPGNYWWRPGGAIAAGAAIGFVTAATAAAWAGAAPAAGYCWYYTDPSRTQGFWDVCP
jgi:hypothetical protein